MPITRLLGSWRGMNMLYESVKEHGSTICAALGEGTPLLSVCSRDGLSDIGIRDKIWQC